MQPSSTCGRALRVRCRSMRRSCPAGARRTAGACRRRRLGGRRQFVVAVEERPSWRPCTLRPSRRCRSRAAIGGNRPGQDSMNSSVSSACRASEVMGDPVIPLRPPVPGCVLEAVQRALARQRRASPALPRVAGQHASRGCRRKSWYVVGLRARAIPVMRCATSVRTECSPIRRGSRRSRPSRRPPGRTARIVAVGPPQQQSSSPVRGDRAAVERRPSPSLPGITLEIRRNAVYTVSASVLRFGHCQVYATINS